jgi:heme-degrading monooxygenase HmoA
MAEGQILWLPERDEPYWIDSFDGFAAAGVSHVTDTSLPAGEQRVEISDKWHGKSARTWFAMTRPPKYGGVLGAGAGAVIDVLDAGFTRPPQGTEDTMTYTDNGGSTFKITGCQEKLFDTSSGKTYWGNFTLRCSPDLGGVAFIGIGAGDATVEQVHFDGCWHGHSFAPNGESGALAVATHTVRRNTFDCHGIGKTSVMMANRAGPSVMEDIRIVNYDDQVGSITYWESKPGVSEWHNVRSPKSVNMEANGSGGVFTLKVFGGTLGGGNYHLNVRSPYSSQVFELHDVERVGGPEVWQANCWGSAPYMQQASTFKAWDEDGNALPTKTAGATAGGTVASLSEAPSFEELVLYLLGQLRTTDPAGLTDRIRSLLSR